MTEQAEMIKPDEEGYYPERAKEQFSPAHYDFLWNKDYSRFRPIRLKWYDDASYIAYQTDFGDVQDE